MNIDIFSFFSGAGFLDLGFEVEKYNIVFVNECNEHFMETYQFARSEMKLDKPKYGYSCEDINELLKGQQKRAFVESVTESKNHSLVGFIGGPPCPDFSIAGKNKGFSGDNGKLTNSYKRIILSQEPDFFVFENVKGLWSTKKHREEYDKLKKSFKRKGYILVDKLVNALEYGVPQDRERIILFGIKYKLLNENRKIANDTLNKDFHWGNLEKYCLKTLFNYNWPTTNEFHKDKESKKPSNIFEELTVEYWFNKNNVYKHFNKEDFFNPHSKERFENILEGDVSRKSFKRLHRWRYSPTAAYGNNEVHLHPYKARRLSVAEALAIQSLPKEFRIPKTMTKSNMFKMIGNGVPFLVAKSIAKEILLFLERNIYN